ncbi:MAG: regulatory protein RecX [Ruminococcaceae bacterium]|nr:regulatory protein RecX [Oscillospiraceae bacterium]
MTVFITSIGAINAGEEMRITFELRSDGGENVQRESFIISSRKYLVMGIEKGECSADFYETVSREAEVWSAVKRGVALLSYGACSEKALRMKLSTKGFDKEIAAEAVLEISSMGVMDAERDALVEAQKCVAKLWGKRRITAELFSKGYSSEAVGFAMRALEESGVDYAENCRKLMLKRRVRITDDLREKQKIFAAVSRYGYSASEIKEAYISLKYK